MRGFEAARGRRALAALVCLALAGCAELGLDPALVDALLGGPRSEETVVAGVREALRVGAERGVARTARPGGFLENPLVRIGLPPELQDIGRALRAVGFDGTVDEIEETMNRAAEQASGEAADLLVDAVRKMTIADAEAIVRGPDDAATRYFRGSSEDALRARFSPVVEGAMKRVGLYRAYDELVDRHSLLSLLGDPTVDLNRYVTDETLDGLFTVLREEEKRIRDDPAARTTELLRQVFGGV
jgi:hypothetical protein